MNYENLKRGDRNVIRIEIGADDVSRWDRVQAAIKGLLEIMAESEGRQHRKMLPADWKGLFCEAEEGAAEKANSLEGGR